MNYKLAKQLKDAGFPQELDKESSVYYKDKLYIFTGGGHLEAGRGQEYFLYEYGFACCDDDGLANEGFLSVYADDKELVKVPTLSELIEECGEEFNSLHKEGRLWCACGIIKNVKICKECGHSKNSHFDEYGKTPWIAVAKLHLKLNEK